MDCQIFLDRYSEYIDEVMDFDGAEQMDAHLQACEACGRYDRVMRRGLDLARAIPAVAPSSDFQMRLEHRLLHVRDEMANEGRTLNGGAAVSLALAGLLALAAWGPLLGRGGTELAELAEWAEQGLPAAEYVVHVGEPVRATLQVDGWWSGAALSGAFNAAGHSLSGAFPGPHSPLVVTPPVDYGNGSGRVMLTSYPGLD